MLQKAGDRELFFFWVLIACFALYAGVNTGVSLWQIANSQHVWCQVINTLNSPPAPKGPASPRSNPSRAYDEKLAKEFRDLKVRFGC